MRPLCIALLLATPALQADPLADLRATLARFQGQEPVKASVDYSFWNKGGDEKKPIVSQGKATAWVEEGPQGLRMMWGRPFLQAAMEEARARAADPEKTTPTRQALDGLSPTEVMEYLNGADELLRSLDQAQLQDVKQEAWQGRPARMLVLKLTPKMGEREKKYVKQLEATARIWVGADGVPLAAEQRVKMKGRALMVISFESEQKEEFRFAVSGTRLIVIHHQSEQSGSGAGEQGQRKTQMSLTLAGS